VVTTLTTVGFGDVVPQTVLGKVLIVATICIGVVLIPVQAAQLYAEFTARRVVRGEHPPARPWRARKDSGGPAAARGGDGGPHGRGCRERCNRQPAAPACQGSEPPGGAQPQLTRWPAAPSRAIP
jgi:hypothetical protein